MAILTRNMQPTQQPSMPDPIDFVPPPVTQPTPGVVNLPPPDASNRLWAKEIPVTNRITLGICWGTLLTIDLLILISSPDLAGFFYPMAAACVIVSIFIAIESAIGEKLRDQPTTGLDQAIVALIGIRNGIAVLNVLPVLQLLGWLVAFLVPFIVIAEIILLVIRLGRANQEIPPQQLA